MTTSNLKHWLSRGELDKLEYVVLEGRGARLLGEQSPDLRTRVFLKGLPNYLTKISQIHDAVVRGSLPEVQRLVEGEPKKKLVIAKDPAGTPLIHKAVYYDHQNVVEWIVDNYPTTVEQKDKEGRTALHYCAACRDPEAVWDILIEAGCDASVCDKRGNPAAYYLQRGAEIELPDPDKMPGHRRRRHAHHDKGQANSLDFKPSNIRIWIHNRDIGKLQQVLWEGHGAKLRCETSNNVRVRRFLEAVPFIMVTIKDIHTAVIKNDIETFRKKIEDPVSPVILSSKDCNGLNVLHKAAGLGYNEIAKDILDKYPAIVTLQDNDGRIPLHYAAVCRDGGVMYDLLVEYGSDESKLDNRGKVAAFYKNRPMDIDLTNLVTVPEAPRVSSNNYPRHWDWRIIDSDQPLPRIKRTGNNVDDDSAFGSAESAKLTEDVITPEIENAEDEMNGNGEENDEEAEHEAEEGEAEVEADAEAAATDENENPTENEEDAEPAGEEGEPDDNNNNEEAEVEAKAEPEFEAESEALAEAEEETDAKAAEETEAPAEEEPETQVKVETEAPVDNGTATEAEVETEAQVKEEAEAETEEETNAQIEEETETGAEEEPKTQAAEETEAQVEEIIETQAEEEPEAQVEEEAEAQVEEIIETQAEEEPEAPVEEEVEAQVEEIIETQAEQEPEAQLEEIIETQAEEEPEAQVEEEIDTRVEEVTEAVEETEAQVEEEPEAQVEDETEAQFEEIIETEAEVEPEIQAEDEPEAEAEEEAKVQVGEDTETQTEEETEAQVAEDTAAQVAEDTETQAKEETEAQAEGETDAEGMEESEAEAKEEIEAQVAEDTAAQVAEDTKTQAKEETEAQAEGGTDTEGMEESEAEAKEEIQAEDEAEVEGEAKAETKAEDEVEVEGEVEVEDGIEGGEEADGEAEAERADEVQEGEEAQEGEETQKGEDAEGADEAQEGDEAEEEGPPEAEEADQETGEAQVPAEEAEQPEPEADDEESDDKGEPSTADSGVARTPNDEEQAAVDEEEEPQAPEAEDEAAVSDENNEGQEAEEEEDDDDEEKAEEEDVEPAADDEEAAELAENGTMEQLAALVLSGEGHRLVNRHSSNPELQAFIDNVPTYMSKIRAVHKAAKEGNLKELQVSLDRRKFAMAKDQSSPHGATPLHVAVIFGHTMIVRYLAGRFPETTHALDLDGRTPLHYAATLADNGHYYNLLLHLGANPLVQDNFGQKAEYYKQNQDDLSHKQLLRDFGAPESLADEMLVDKDLKIFHDEEGRYLASSLGDPLIKGLTEVATTRPKDPVTYLATYLYNFANQEKPKDGEESNILIIPEEQNGHAENDDDSQDNENDDGYPQSPDLDAPESLFAETERDEEGQSTLHFAANRSHSKDGLYHHLQETQINIALRDSRYRTGRDVAEAAGNKENVQEIDRFVVYLAARGETDKLVELLMEGYDHILDAEDDGKNILQIAEEEGNQSTVEFLKSIDNYTDLRDEIHRGVRTGDLLKVRELLEMNGKGAKLLALGKNTMGRCSLHIAVLREHEDIVRYLAKTYPETLRVGDNMDRTALHYAMGVPSVEVMSSTLIKAGAKRIQKDAKSRQPSYYFMNKTDIEKLQEEEASLEK